MTKKLDLSDHARLRHHRDRNLGIPTNKQLVPAPMLFNRDGLNIFLGDTYRGCDAFLILSGPSFGDVIKGESEFRGKKVPNKELLQYPGFVTMAVNNAPRTFRPNLWTLVDKPTSFIKSIWLDPKITKFVPFDHAEKKLFDNEKWVEMDKLVGECPNIHFYRRNEHFDPNQWLQEGSFNWGEHSKSNDELGIKGSRSVMLVAIKLLYYLGVRRIFLLGCDFNMDENTKYHFEQDRSVGSQKGNNATYQILNKRFTALLPHFEEAGLKIYNCNDKSKLTVFPFIDFDKAIKLATDQMPDIYTERTEGLYDREAKEKEKQKSMKAAQPVAGMTIDINKETFTTDEKIFVKQELDRLRKTLDDMKHSRDTYKMMPDANTETLEKLEAAVVKARQKFKDYEIIKNNVWGIIKQ